MARAILLPLAMALAGLGAGVGAGLALRPPAPPPAEGAAPAAGPRDYVRLTNQFIVPVVERGSVAALVILALSLEVKAGQTEAVYAREPKIRDALLRVLFDHANAGGFRGTYTDPTALAAVRRSLLEAAVAVMGPVVTDVLIVDLVRQDG